MLRLLHLLILLLLLAVPGQGGEQDANVTIEALMPPFPTDKEDAYLCTSLPLPNNPLKLTAVEALARQEIVHHILLFGELPGLSGQTGRVSCAGSLQKLWEGTATCLEGTLSWYLGIAL